MYKDLLNPLPMIYLSDMEKKLSTIINIEKGIDKTNAHIFCAEVFGVQPEELFKKNRKNILAKHLWRYMWWCFTNNPQLLEKLKIADRCTIIHSMTTINDLCWCDLKVKEKIQRVEAVYGIKIINAYTPNPYFYTKKK